MNEKELNYILEEIKKVNNLSGKIFDYLYKTDKRKFAKSIYRLMQIDEILSYLEIVLEIKLGIDEVSLEGGKNNE